MTTGSEGRAGLTVAVRNRDFALLLLGQTVSGIGTWAYGVALAVYVFQVTHSPAWVGAAFGCRMLATLVFSPYSGLVADRYERRRLMQGADALAFVWMSLLAVVAAFHAPALLAVGLATLTSISQIVYRPAVAAATPELVSESELAAANALLGSIDSAIMIAGPAIGGVLLILGSPAAVFALNAATFLVSFAAVTLIRARSKPPAFERDQSQLRQIAAGFKALLSSVDAIVLTGLTVLTSFTYGTDTVLLVLVAQDKLHTGANGFGYLLAGIGLGGLLATPVASRLARSHRLALILVAAMAVYCLPTAVLTFTTSPGLAFVVEVVRGIGTFVVDVLVITELQRTLPRELTARVFGIFWALVLGAIALGALVAPPILALIQLNASLVGAAVFAPALTALLYIWLRRMDARAQAAIEALEPKVAAIEKLGIFAAAPRPVLESLAGACEELSVPSGHAIVTEGEPADAFYVILEGSADVTARGENTRERKLRTLEAGQYFGEIGLLEGIPRTATVTAVTPCRLYRIEGESFVQALTTAAATPAFIANARAGLAITNPEFQPARGLNATLEQAAAPS